MKENYKKAIPAVVSVDALQKLDAVIAAANKKNNKNFLNRSKIMCEALVNETLTSLKDKAEYEKEDKKATTSFSLGLDDINNLKSFKKEHGTTPSLLLNTLLKQELDTLSELDTHCSRIIVGTQGDKYMVSLAKLHGLNGVDAASKETIKETGELIQHYENGDFVVVPYSVIFTNLYRAEAS